jgi:hypothetical protein
MTTSSSVTRRRRLKRRVGDGNQTRTVSLGTVQGALVRTLSVSSANNRVAWSDLARPAVMAR